MLTNLFLPQIPPTGQPMAADSARGQMRKIESSRRKNYGFTNRYAAVHTMLHTRRNLLFTYNNSRKQRGNECLGSRIPFLYILSQGGLSTLAGLATVTTTTYYAHTLAQKETKETHAVSNKRGD